MFRILNHKYLLCCVSCNLISSFIIINNESVSVVMVKLKHRIEMCIGNEKINLCMNMKAVSMVCQLSGLRFLSKASEGRSINTEPAQP